MAKKAPGSPVSFTLKIKGAGEDVPRELLAFGPACEGNILFVMHPRADKAILIHAIGKGKNETAKVWRTDAGLAPSFHPRLNIDIGTAVEEAQALKAAVPGAGPELLKGSWSGKLLCDGTDAGVRVELARKVVSYGTLRLKSDAAGRWHASFEREARWFAEGATKSVESPSLGEAIKAGMGLAMGLVKDACVVRDTRRRGSMDAEHAAKHPPKPRAPVKDPSERYIAKRSGVPSLKTVQVDATCPTCVDGMQDASKATAGAAKRLGAASVNLDDVKDAPAFLNRAAKLIRKAGMLLESPLCREGEEKRVALDAIKKAIAAFNAARTAYLEAHDKDIALERRLRVIAEQVALGAAKIGRSCSTGQTRMAMPKGGWTHNLDSGDAPSAVEIVNASKAVDRAMRELAKETGSELRTPDEGGDVYLGRSKRAKGDIPAGSLIVVTSDGMGFYWHPPVEDAPVAASSKRGKAPGSAKAPKPAQGGAKPPNAYMAWSVPWIAEQRRLDPSLSQKDAMIRAGAEWKRQQGGDASSAPSRRKAPVTPPASRTDKQKDKVILAAVGKGMKDLAAEIRAGMA